MDATDGIDDRVTAASLDALAAALAVRWPVWYPPFVLALAAKPNESRPFWLAGGFIFASPRRAYEETVRFRAGGRFHCGGSWERPGEQQPLPEHFVVVGETGEGPVIVNTADGAAVWLWLDKEGYWRDPLIAL